MSQFILFWNDTLHVSDGFSVHHQEFKTVHTATGICQTDTADCLLASSQQALVHLVGFTIELDIQAFFTLTLDGGEIRFHTSVVPQFFVPFVIGC